MTKKITWMFMLLFGISSVIVSCKKKEKEKTYSNSDYVGTWNATTKCSSSMSYKTTITTSGSSGIVLSNFHAPASTDGYTLNASVSDKTITIASQTITNSQGGNKLTFSGSGTLSPPSSLSISYTVKDPISGATLSCTATCTK